MCMYFLGYLLFRDFCLNQVEEAKPLVEFYEEVRPWLWRNSQFFQFREICATLSDLTCKVSDVGKLGDDEMTFGRHKEGSA